MSTTLNRREPRDYMMSTADWDAYISSATTIVAAQDRMQEAVFAGVDFAALLRLQSARVSS